LLAPLYGSRVRPELVQIEWLVDIAIGPELQYDDAVDGRRMPARHENWNVSDRPDPSQAIEAIAPRGVDIQENEIPLSAPDQD
jgi:hypothetical protein